MSGLTEIPVHDFRTGGLPAFTQHRLDAGADLLDTVLGGLGFAGTLLRPLLPIGDRIAARYLTRTGDPYRDEILALPGLIGRSGPVAFSLSYEWGCTTRIFETGGAPQLFRTLDWPFHGLGARIEVVHLSGPAGDWVTATWPGTMGTLHGAAAGRFAIALNQAPDRQTGFGRAVDWLVAKRRFLRAGGLPPTHLLRQVFEQAPDYATAHRMLSQTPVAAPVIFTLAGTQAGEACTIERTETAAASPGSSPTVAANHFTTALGSDRRWRMRGYDSAGRLRAAAQLVQPPAVDQLTAPILNPLTRLALNIDALGNLSVAGYEGLTLVTAPRHTSPLS